MQSHFTREFQATVGELTSREIEMARHLVASKYSTEAWISRLA